MKNLILMLFVFTVNLGININTSSAALDLTESQLTEFLDHKTGSTFTDEEITQALSSHIAYLSPMDFNQVVALLLVDFKNNLNHRLKISQIMQTLFELTANELAKQNSDSWTNKIIVNSVVAYLTLSSVQAPTRSALKIIQEGSLAGQNQKLLSFVSQMIKNSVKASNLTSTQKARLAGISIIWGESTVLYDKLKTYKINPKEALRDLELEIVISHKQYYQSLTEAWNNYALQTLTVGQVQFAKNTFDKSVLVAEQITKLGQIDPSITPEIQKTLFFINELQNRLKTFL